MRSSIFSKKDKSKKTKELIKETNNLLNQIRKKMESQLLTLSERTTNKLCELTAFGFLYEIIKKLEIVVLIIENQHFNSFNPLARELLELGSQLQFLLKEEETYEVKALRYQYLEQLRRSEKFKEKPNYDDFIKQILENKEYEIGKNSIKAQKCNPLKCKWYNYNGKIKTLRDLCSEIDFNNEYDVIYRDLSIQTHGLNVGLSTFYSPDNKNLFFRNINTLNDPHFPIVVHVLVKINFEIIEKIREFYKFTDDKEHRLWKSKYIGGSFFNLIEKWDEFSFQDSFNKNKINLKISGTFY